MHCKSYLCVSVRFRLIPLPLVEFSFGTDGNQFRVQSPNADKLCYIVLKDHTTKDTELSNYTNKLFIKN